MQARDSQRRESEGRVGGQLTGWARASVGVAPESPELLVERGDVAVSWIGNMQCQPVGGDPRPCNSPEGRVRWRESCALCFLCKVGGSKVRWCSLAGGVWKPALKLAGGVHRGRTRAYI